MKKFIKKVATGPKGNEDFSFEEAAEAMRLMLSSDVSDVEKSSFLVGWRLKPETNEEYRGALQALLKNTISSPIENSFELGFPYDGKNDFPFLFPLVGKFLKNQGINLVVTGCERVPSKEGVNVKMIHQRLKGTNLEGYYHYFERKNYLPAFSELAPMRNQIGLRTALNTLEKFSLVARSSFGATGVFHKPYVNKYAEIFKDHLTRFLLVSGAEGSPELCKRSKVWIVDGAEILELFVDPEEFGIRSESFGSYSLPLTLDDQIKHLMEPSESMIQMARLNAALYLLVVCKGSDLKENFNKLFWG